MKECKNCIYFRPCRPLSQLIIREMGINDSQLLSEIVNLSQDENRKKDSEAEMLVELIEKGEWSSKPMMSDYCGYDEKKKKYLMCEVKNSDYNCSDYKESDGKLKSCKACIYQKIGIGNEKDKEIFDEYDKLIKNDSALQQGGSSFEEFKKYIQKISARKILEINETYFGGKFVFREPLYITTCKKFSTSTDFIPCIVQNSHEQCDDWDDGTKNTIMTKKASNPEEKMPSWQDWKNRNK